ncbi:MAG: enoyl-CoA hydratase/isomerase family protein [Deltaproteobacteria bacterium]|nr:enoyl-CoA hydratase/isomerase family protein [Deltaproteobacteria bacterium]
MSYQHILTASNHGVATIILNRPPLNVLNIEMMNEINRELDRLMGEPPTLLVFRAEGKAFSAGVDVGEHVGDLMPKMIDAFHGIFRRMDALGAPSIAAVQGSALGGGCELAVYCDMVIASERAKIGQPEIKVGVFPPIAALILPRIIGRKKAMEFILSGDTWSAEEAQCAGMINHVAPADDFDTEVQSYIGRFVGNSAVVMKLTRESALCGLQDDPGAGLDRIEKLYMEKLMKTHDANEGLESFLGKRPPAWKDR